MFSHNILTFSSAVKVHQHVCEDVYLLIEHYVEVLLVV